MAFVETPRFPDYLAYGLRVGPRFNTSVVRVESGFEQRNELWSFPLVSLDGSTTHRTAAQKDEIDWFFRAMGGRRDGFRVRNPADYKDESHGIVSLISGNSYQIQKQYVYGAVSLARDITKPYNDGTFTVTGGGSYTVDYTTGIITRNSGAVPTGWTGKFDIPVRFDQDELVWTIAAPGASNDYLYTVEALKLVEIRV
jgi:uncharacterized protein (TIGR02217 family)